MNAHNGPKAMFSRLASDGSDEIVDFEEKSRKPSPIGTPPEANAAERMQSGRTRLGKRDKPASSPESGPNSAKRPRRLVGVGNPATCVVTEPLCRGPICVAAQSLNRTGLCKR